MKKNRIDLMERVGYIKCKFIDNDKGSVKTDINLGIKKNSLSDKDEKNWDNVFITFWNTEKRKTAESPVLQTSTSDASIASYGVNIFKSGFISLSVPLKKL